MQDMVDDLRGCGAIKRHPPRQQLEEDNAQGKQINAMIDGSAERLLRCHVRHRPDHDPGHRHLRLGDVAAGAAADEFRETEIENLDQSPLGAHQVCALDVAMNNAARVRLVEGIGDLDANLDDFTQRDGTTRDPCRQQLTVDVLHDDEVGAGFFSDVVGDGNVRRTQHRRRTRFVEEARPALGIGLQRRRQELERDRPAKSCIFTTIHLSHAAGAQAFVNAIMLDGRANHFLL